MASELYDRLKAAYDLLERSGGSRSEWLQLSVRVVEAVMKCQQIVIDRQKDLVAHARGPTTGTEFLATRQASRDAIRILDKLTALHQQIKARRLT